MRTAIAVFGAVLFMVSLAAGGAEPATATASMPSVATAPLPSAAAAAPVALSPAEARHKTLEEIRIFLTLKDKAVGNDWEYDGCRGPWNAWHGLEPEARMALAAAGDPEGINYLVMKYDLDEADKKVWFKKHGDRAYGVPWTEEYLSLPAVLELSRPDLAAALEARMAQAQFHTATSWEEWRKGIVAKLDQMSMESLAKAATGADYEVRVMAMIRWVRLDRAGASKVLVPIMNDPKQEGDVRCNAAQALAMAGDEEAMKWLRDAVLQRIGLGGQPGVALLMSGPKGAAMYFETVEAYRKANPEKPLPGDLVNVYGYCADDVFFLYLDKLLDITVSTPGHSIPADSYAYDLRVSVADRRLPVETLITLIDRLKKQNYADRDLLNGVVRSLATYPGDEPARQRAALWADELIRSADSQLWKSGMGLFRHGFGTRAVALAAARKHLAADPQTAAPLLAQIGREADAAAIYAATHDPPGAKPALPKDRYSRVAIGWTPIVLLTNP